MPLALAISDAADARRKLQRALEGSGLDVRAVQDLARAEALVDEVPTDVLIVKDDEDELGPSIARALRLVEGDSPRVHALVLFAASPPAGLESAALDLTGIDYLAHPYDPLDVRAWLRAIVPVATRRPPNDGLEAQLERALEALLHETAAFLEAGESAPFASGVGGDLAKLAERFADAARICRIDAGDLFDAAWQAPASDRTLYERLGRLHGRLRPALAATLRFARGLRGRRQHAFEAWDESALARIERHARSLLRLAEDVHEVACLGIEVAAAPAPFDPIRHLEQSVMVADASCRSLGIDLRCGIVSPFPEAVIGRRQVLRSIVGHLLENATRYARATIDIHARFRLDGADGSALELSVSDDGPGIDPLDRAIIFDRFGRGRRRPLRGTSAGLGVGLHVARALAERSGGSLTLARTEIGARFDLILPMDLEEDGK